MTHYSQSEIITVFKERFPTKKVTWETLMHTDREFFIIQANYILYNKRQERGKKRLVYIYYLMRAFAFRSSDAANSIIKTCLDLILTTNDEKLIDKCLEFIDAQKDIFSDQIGIYNLLSTAFLNINIKKRFNYSFSGRPIKISKKKTPIRLYMRINKVFANILIYSGAECIEEGKDNNGYDYEALFNSLEKNIDCKKIKNNRTRSLYDDVIWYIKKCFVKIHKCRCGGKLYRLNNEFVFCDKCHFFGMGRKQGKGVKKNEDYVEQYLDDHFELITQIQRLRNLLKEGSENKMRKIRIK